MPNPRADVVYGRMMNRLAGLDAEHRTDAELAERFARQRDEAAFEALLRRHGPMVWRQCRRLLRCEQDAEDVFQATFVVFARRASAVRKFASVGPWLFGVASRLAAKSRACSRRRAEKDARARVVS
jgi:DNA-directed RNA polymerase specialized sigma24 family protein